MKRDALISRFIPVCLLVLMLLAACGGPSTPPPTPLPTATATPRSTPIPEVPTAIPLASEENPLTILMLPQGTRRTAATVDEDLADLILELAGLNVEVELVNSYGEIVAQLCSAAPAVGWVDGFAYIVAEAQGCADLALVVERDNAPGFQVDMLMNADFVGDEPDPDDVARLDDEIVCRIDSQDTVSWLLPSLMLEAAGVDASYDLDEVLEVEDYDALITAIYNGDCVGGAVPHDYLEDDISADVRALEDLDTRVVRIVESPVVPYDVLVYPQTVPLNVRIPLSDIFVQLAADDDNSALLATILQQDSLARVGLEDFDEFRAFMQATGYDFTALGE
jgi:ABC-type phosphate/phosphonate transport system substrate-binding protein